MAVLEPRVIRVGRRDWAFGLRWELGDAVGLAWEARRAAGDSPVGLRKSHGEFAVGTREVRGRPAAAAAVAGAAPGMRWAVWRLEGADDDEEAGLWWGLASSRGVVLPGVGDRLMETREDVRAWVAELGQTGAEWEVSLGPGWLGPAVSGTPQDLGEVLDGAKGRRVVVGAGGTAVTRIAGVVGGLGILGAGWALAPIVEEWLWPAPVVVAPVEPKLVVEAPVLEPVPVPEAVLVRDGLAGCVDAFGEVFASPPSAGWTTGEAVCAVGAGELSVSVPVIADGAVPIALWGVRRERGGGEISLGGRSAVRTAGRAVGVVRAPRASGEGVVWALSALRDGMGGEAEISTRSAPVTYDPVRELPAEWSRLEWSFATGWPPGLWERDLASVPGLVVDRVTYTFGAGWRVEGWARIGGVSAGAGGGHAG